VGNPSRKLSVPENFNKPPSPKESDINVDPLTDKPKQPSISSASSIKPPSTLQPPFVLQQQQQQKGLVTVVSQSKPSPPLANKRPTAIPRKPVATSAKNHAIQSGLGDFEYYQVDMPTSHSTEELSSLLAAQHAELSNDESLSPPMVAENQFSFTRHSSTNQQQVRCVEVVNCRM